MIDLNDRLKGEAMLKKLNPAIAIAMLPIDGIVEDSEKLGKEIATAVCENDGFLSLESDRILGNEETVLRTSKCLVGRRIGEVHTHPDAKEVGLSSLDLAGVVNSQDDFTCSLTSGSDKIFIACAKKMLGGIHYSFFEHKKRNIFD